MIVSLVDTMTNTGNQVTMITKDLYIGFYSSYLYIQDIVYKCKNMDELGRRFPERPLLEIV